MAMEITNNYSNYATNYTDSTKKSDSKAAAEVKTNTQASSKDKVQEYYEKLCKKFPQINFNTNGGVLASNSSKVTVNLSYDCLKKMANDPEFAKEIEWNLSGETAANSMVYGWAQRDGVMLGGRTVTYDANGNRQSSCGGMRTANAGNGNNNTNKTQKKYKEEEERWLKARKKREEKEKLEKKRAEKKAAEEARTETGYSNVNDYSKYLQGKYSYMNTGTISMQGIPTTVSVSSAFLQKCMNDPEKAKYLEENLAAIPDCVKSLNNYVKMAPGSPVVTYAAYKIDENGNISIMSGGTNDPDGKIARENAERKAKENREKEEKIKEKRAAKREEEERLAAKRAAEKPETYTVNITGTNVESITEQLVKRAVPASAVTTPAFSMTGFDAKA